MLFLPLFPPDGCRPTSFSLLKMKLWLHATNVFLCFLLVMYYTITHPTFQQESLTGSKHLHYLKVSPQSNHRKINFLWIVINIHVLLKKNLTHLYDIITQVTILKESKIRRNTNSVFTESQKAQLGGILRDHLILCNSCNTACQKYLSLLAVPFPVLCFPLEHLPQYPTKISLAHLSSLLFILPTSHRWQSVWFHAAFYSAADYYHVPRQSSLSQRTQDPLIIDLTGHHRITEC